MLFPRLLEIPRLGAVFGVLVDTLVVLLYVLGGTPTDSMLRYLASATIYSIYIVAGAFDPRYQLPYPG